MSYRDRSRDRGRDRDRDRERPQLDHDSTLSGLGSATARPPAASGVPWGVLRGRSGTQVISTRDSLEEPQGSLKSLGEPGGHWVP